MFDAFGNGRVTATSPIRTCSPRSLCHLELPMSDPSSTPDAPQPQSSQKSGTSGSKSQVFQRDSNTNPVKRAVEKTVDRLSKSVSGITNPISIPSPTRRRMFSISQRNKEAVAPHENEGMSCLTKQITLVYPQAFRATGPCLCRLKECNCIRLHQATKFAWARWRS